MERMAEAFRAVDVVRVREGRRLPEVDQPVTEEPLEVRLHGRPFAVIMRTPGADHELVAWFLLAERVLRSADDVGTIEYCESAARLETGTTTAAAYPDADATTGGTTETIKNIVNVTLARDSDDALELTLAGRRQVTTSAACGLCGRLGDVPLAVEI